MWAGTSSNCCCIVAMIAWSSSRSMRYSYRLTNRPAALAVMLRVSMLSKRSTVCLRIFAMCRPTAPIAERILRTCPAGLLRWLGRIGAPLLIFVVQAVAIIAQRLVARHLADFIRRVDLAAAKHLLVDGGHLVGALDLLAGAGFGEVGPVEVPTNCRGRDDADFLQARDDSHDVGDDDCGPAAHDRLCPLVGILGAGALAGLRPQENLHGDAERSREHHQRSLDKLLRL